MSKEKEHRTPRGVILIATLLILGAFFAAGVGALFPSQTLVSFNQPRSLLLVGALVTALLGYGLLRLRRWAWFATLSFVFVNTYFLVLSARLQGRVEYVGLGLLVAVGVYMLLPAVRSVFLRQDPK